jgi:hypothetical protein
MTLRTLVAHPKKNQSLRKLRGMPKVYHLHLKKSQIASR